MKFPFFRQKLFEPRFPIVPLNISEEEAVRILETHAPVEREEPDDEDRSISQHVLYSESDHTRIQVGIWDRRVRFVNYLTEHFNRTEKQRGAKLAYFVNLYGGADEFDEPGDTGFLILWRNPKRKVLIMFGLHCGPVRTIDEDPNHWNNDEAEQGDADKPNLAAS